MQDSVKNSTKTILIRVTSFVDGGVEKEYYRNTITWSPDVYFPYESIEQSLRVLYPKGRLVSFTVG